MQFTNAEVRFLSQGRNSRGMHWAAIDFGMSLRCPQNIMQRILERRAKELGPEFTAFQHEQRAQANPNSPYQPAPANASELF
jgi:hypothetical protein